MDRHIAKYIGISDPNFIAIIRRSIDLYKWIQQKNSRKELLTVEEKILIEEKLEDRKISSVEDGIKGDYFLLTKKRIIDNVDDSSTKKKMNNRIRVAKMTLNESELEVLSEENLKEAENKAALLYAECGCLDYRVEDTKEIISLFNKKEKFFKDKTDKSKELVLEETLVSKANLNIEDKDKMLDLEIGLLQPQSLDKREQNLRGWKKILKKKCLTENTISRNKEIQNKVKKHCKMIVNNQGQMLVSLLNKLYNKIIINKLVLEKQDHSQELITKPEEVMSITEKHFQNQYQKRNTRPNLLTQKWTKIYKPASYVQESLYENLLEEISDKEWKQMLSSLRP
ncbi:27140_t:CDS:2 [Gigaspora margarita]|uniref:27140_t:CDS:1 n=1 Tax=Gigaspora margarita TaxID=4874 RepID=A0ABN7V657_GIGMA|nr:27140_t:CDS:2 [Gigaspora margarita]